MVVTSNSNLTLRLTDCGTKCFTEKISKKIYNTIVEMWNKQRTISKICHYVNTKKKKDFVWKWKPFSPKVLWQAVPKVSSTETKMDLFVYTGAKTCFVINRNQNLPPHGPSFWYSTWKPVPVDKANLEAAFLKSLSDMYSCAGPLNDLMTMFEFSSKTDMERVGWF